MREPEVILDEAHEQIVERVCAIDVGKDSGKVCVRLPAESGSGRRASKVWDVPARTRAVIELGDHLACQGIEKVTVESTSDYWRIWFYLLEARGLDVQLVNARDVKNVPGRPKTDKLDSMWLAKLTEKGLLRPSFVPPQQIRVLRDYTRLRVDLTAERTRHWQRLEKLLEDALIKITAGLVPYPAVQPGPQHVQFCLSGSRDALLRPGSLRTGYVEIHINGSKRAGG